MVNQIDFLCLSADLMMPRLTSPSFGRHQLSEDYEIEITLCLMKDEILEAKELLKAKSVNQTGPPPGVLDPQLAQYRSLLQLDEGGPKNPGGP